MHLHSAFTDLARRTTATVLGACTALVLVVATAHAGGAVGPNIDGNGQDLIDFAAGIGNAGCGVSVVDARDDISISDPQIIVCGVKEDTDANAVADYFVNGFDVRQFVFAYDRANRSLYALWRTEGFIADTDGNGNPDNNLCPPDVPTFADEPGIGSQENYQIRLDTNCDGITDIIVSVGGVLGSDVVSVQGATFSGSAVAYRAGAGSGKDLELRIDNIDLPAAFRIRANANASFDGLGEDITAQVNCDPNPAITIDKSSNIAAICPGGSADFTIVVTNSGNVPLSNVSVVDNVPAGLVYNQTVSNTCGGATNVNGSQVTWGPFDLAVGASCTIVMRADAAAGCSGQITNIASVEGTFQSPCFNGGEATTVSDQDDYSLVCGSATCSISAPDTRVCGSETVEICGPEGNYSYLWSNGATTRCINVGAGTYSLVITDLASGCQSTNPCSVTIEQDTPLIEVDKAVSPEGAVDQGASLTYTLTITNPAWSTITAEAITVTDYLCDMVTYQGNASVAPTSAPNVGESGNIVWNIGPLAPGASATITFDARVRELPAPECENPELSCVNRVEVSTACGDKVVTDEDQVTTPILPCVQTGLCRLTGGGCLNEEGGNRGHKQNTFGGNSSPFHEGGGPTGNSWEHVYRDGKTILFNWHSWDAHVIQCSVVEPGPCSPQAVNTRADFVGTGKYSLGAGGRSEDGNMVAYIIDHKEGACNRDNRDEYYITVREGLVIGEGAIVFQTGGEIDCGNLQIHETPRRLFGGTTIAPGDLNEVDGSVALLNKAVPNPFRASMSYAYEITGADQPVEVSVYNVAGRMVKSLVRSTQPVGRHTVTWDGADDAGARVPSGVYFVRVRMGAAQSQQRVIYLGQ